MTNKIPKRLRLPNARFIKVQKTTKRTIKENKTKAPAQKTWDLEHSYKWDDEELQKHINDGGNYGIINASISLIVIDADDVKISEVIKDIFPTTLVIKTHGERRHLYYFCENCSILGKQYLKDKMGDIRGYKTEDGNITNYYTVCPGSIHKSGETYTVHCDNDISKIDDKLLIDTLKPYFKSEKSEKGNTKVKPTLAGAEQGLRHATLHKTAIKMFFDGYEAVAIKSVLMSMESNELPPRKTETEIDNIVRDAKKWVEKENEKQKKTVKKPLTEKQKEKNYNKLQSNNLLLDVIKEVHKTYSGEYDTLMAMICQISTRLVIDAQPESQNITLTGEPGIGKDRLAEALYKILVHRNDFNQFSKCSPESLAYLHNNEKDWNWDGKVIVIEDPKTELITSQTLKTFLSGKGKTGISVYKGKSQSLEIKGKPAIVLTTAKGENDDETVRRLPCIELDASEGLTRNVKILQAKRYAKKLRYIEPDNELRDALHGLERYKVVIPFAESLVDYFPNSVLMRTHFARFLDYIAGSTAFFQSQRDRDEDGYLIATGEDYELARITLIKATSNSAMISLNGEQTRMLDYMHECTDTDKHVFAARFPWEIMDDLAKDKNFVFDTLRMLKRNGLVRTVDKFNEKASRTTTAYVYEQKNTMRLPLWSEFSQGVDGRSMEGRLNRPNDENPFESIANEMWSMGSLQICICVTKLWKKYYYHKHSFYEFNKKLCTIHDSIDDPSTPPTTGE